jgi:hypothetical protein
MASGIYFLCALTSLLCTFLVIRGYLHSRTRLLLWICAFFVCQAVNNILLFVDLALYGDAYDLWFLRHFTAFVGLVALLYGLVRDTP